MPSVFYDNQYNSTFFTTCCKVAICDDQQKCPRCRTDIYPFYDGMTDSERSQAVWWLLQPQHAPCSHERRKAKVLICAR